MRGVLGTDMKSMNTAKAAAMIMISLFLLTSCVTVPPGEHQSSARESTTAGVFDNPSDILPPADTGDHGKRASRIADRAIKDAINFLRIYPAGNVLWVHPKRYLVVIS